MMKTIYFYLCCFIVSLGLGSCIRHDMDKSCKQEFRESGVRLHIGANKGVETRGSRTIDSSIMEGDDLISELEVYLLRKKSGGYVSCLQKNEPCFSETYEKPVSQVTVDIDIESLDGDTYYVIALANMKYLNMENPLNLFDDQGFFNFEEYVKYKPIYFDQSPLSGQFPMSNANVNEGGEDSFFELYKIVIEEEPTADVEIEVGLDRLVACVHVKNTETLDTSLGIEDGLLLKYKDFAIFNLFPADYIIKHWVRENDNLVIQKPLDKVTRALGWDVYYEKQWGDIEGYFNKEIKILPENSPYYKSEKGKPTQGEATGVLIRVSGFKDGVETPMYALKEEDGYKLYAGTPSNVNDAIVYPNGMFYTLYLQERKNPLLNGDAHYGVVRNTAYLLTIISIDNLGGIRPFEDLPTPDEDGGIRESLTNIELHIQPWRNAELNFN